MMHKDDLAERFLGHLSSQSRLADVAAERARRVQVETADRLAPVLLKLGLLSESDLASEMAAFSGHPRIEPGAAVRRFEGDDFAVTDTFLRAHQLVRVAGDGGELTIACWDALDEYVGVQSHRSAPL